jgi:uncharacterized protein
MLRKRYFQEKIEKDLKNKMVFIGGPRQVGKTTLAKLISKESYPASRYFNWDNPQDRKKILAGRFFDPETRLVIFDEIHKYKKWKNFVKGQFDKHKEEFTILVTGSARLDIYMRGGDSLMGRYYYFRLHPLSLAEISNITPNTKPFGKLIFSHGKNLSSDCKNLLAFGGFPEPFFKKDKEELLRWHNQRIDRLVREDIRDIENLRDLSAIQILVEILPEKVGSLLSLNSLREDMEVAYDTIKLWMNILEKFYYHFRIYPFSKKTIRSLKKEPKMYLWDWSQVPNEAAKLENMVASHLLKFCHFLYDAKGIKAELFYLRDIEKREVDFLITIDKEPWFAVEVKNSDQKVSKNLLYFGKKLSIPFKYQLVNIEDVDFIQSDIRVMSVEKFLSALV